MAKVLGIGGVFLQFKGEAKEVREWYEEFLGLNMSPYGTSFTEGEQLTLLSFSRTNDETQPMLNLRVDDILILIEFLRKQGVTISSEIQTYSYGKFAQFKDPFGNYIELWEPEINEYKKMVEEEILQNKKASSLNK